MGKFVFFQRRASTGSAAPRRRLYRASRAAAPLGRARAAGAAAGSAEKKNAYKLSLLWLMFDGPFGPEIAISELSRCDGRILRVRERPKSGPDSFRDRPGTRFRACWPRSVKDSCKFCRFAKFRWF